MASGFQLPRKSESTSEFIVPDAGVYTLEFFAYEQPVPSSFDEEKLRMRLKFVIVDDEEFDGVEIHEWFGVSMHVRSKLYPVIKALRGGQEIDEDEDINLDDLLGHRIQGTLEVVEKARRDNPTEMMSFANLVAAAPIRRKKANPQGHGSTLAEAKADRAKKLKAQEPEADDVWDDEAGAA